MLSKAQPVTHSFFVLLFVAMRATFLSVGGGVRPVMPMPSVTVAAIRAMSIVSLTLNARRERRIERRSLSENPSGRDFSAAFYPCCLKTLTFSLPPNRIFCYNIGDCKMTSRRSRMASITLRDVPKRTVDTLKRRAVRNHRSLNGEIQAKLTYIVSFSEKFDFPLYSGMTTKAAQDSDPLLALAGKWEDSRPTESIIAEIEGARTMGREVPL